jgi:hypothetical protein
VSAVYGVYLYVDTIPKTEDAISNFSLSKVAFHIQNYLIFFIITTRMLAYNKEKYRTKKVHTENKEASLLSPH